MSREIQAVEGLAGGLRDSHSSHICAIYAVNLLESIKPTQKCTDFEKCADVKVFQQP